MVVGKWVELPKQETRVVNVTVTLVMLTVLLPILHVLCIRWYTLSLR